MTTLGVAIFVVTYVLISARRFDVLGLDRPAAVLLGAVACVVGQVLSPADALAAVDLNTLLLLFGMMGMGAFLAIDGFFEALQERIVAMSGTPARLLGWTVWGAGVLSALITNDAVCVLAAPLLVKVVQTHRLPPTPFLLALATGANTGSVATLVGNPQNMLCGSLGELSYREHLLLLAPVAVFGLAMNHGLLWWCFRSVLHSAQLGSAPRVHFVSPRAWVSLGVVVVVSLIYTVGGDLAWTAASGFVALMLMHRRDTRQLWPRIDWSLLLFFAGLFVVVAGFVRTGVPARVLSEFPWASTGEPVGWLGLSAVFLVGSNVVSNVPFILLIRESMVNAPDPRMAWELLAMASTFAGNLTLLGSVANIIVAEAARDVGGLGFWAHLRVGLPLTLATTLAGTWWIAAWG